MFVFTKSVPTILVLLVWLGVFVSLFAANEVGRRFKWVGFGFFVALLANVGVFVYMVYRIVKTKKNPYTGELYADLKKYQEVKELAE